jgi:serine acetyltransferase
MRVLREILADTLSIARGFNHGRTGWREVTTSLAHDSSLALAFNRLREAARRNHVPLMGNAVRRLQTALFGIEISRDAKLGEGVVFLHTVGVVIGGDSEIGDRVVFLGSNTIGEAGGTGYPRIGNDVVIGAGARILGPIVVGDGATIGANAVVLRDVPPRALAVGVPATVQQRREVVTKLDAEARSGR